MTITALDPADHRQATINVAGPAALMVAKLAERRADPGRLLDKDAHDIYRLLVATDAAELAARLEALAGDELAGNVTRAAVAYLRELFAPKTGGGLGGVMAGRAEELVGDPAVVTAAVTALAGDVLDALETRD